MGIEILLRDVLQSDLQAFYEHQLAPEATHMAGFPSRDHSAFMAHWEKKMRDSTTILKTIVSQGEVVGNIVSWEQSGERNVGYWLGKDFWGNGIATAALSLFLEQVENRPIFAYGTRHNTASIRVLQKCGFFSCSESPCPDAGGEEAGEFVMMLT